MISDNASQVATADWATIDDITIDTLSGGEIRLSYFFTATTNDVQVKVAASVNNVNWIDLNTRDMVSPDMQQAVLTVLSGQSAVAIIAPEDASGINCGFRYYRVQIKGSATYGTLNAWVMAK